MINMPESAVQINAGISVQATEMESSVAKRPRLGAEDGVVEEDRRGG